MGTGRLAGRTETEVAFEIPPALAVRVAVCVLETLSAVTLKMTLRLPTEMGTEGGGASAALLLEMETDTGLPEGALLRPTVQAVVERWTTAAGEQLKYVSKTGAVTESGLTTGLPFNGAVHCCGSSAETG